MELTNNTFLELREKVAETQNQNGDYALSLKKPIVVEEGDQLVLQKAIIDSRSIDAGKIVLDNDTDFKIQFTPYISLFQADNKYEWSTAGATPLPGANINGDNFLLTKKITTGVALVNLLDIEVPPNPATPYPSDKGFTATFTYRDAGDSPKTAHVEMERAGFNWVSKPLGTDLNIIARKDTFQFNQATIDTINEFGGIAAETDFRAEEVNAGIIYQPVVFERNVTLEAGSYAPTDFAKRLTDKFSLLNEDHEFTATNPTDPNNLLLMDTSSAAYTSIGANLDERPWINMTTPPQATAPQNIFALKKDGVQDYFFGTTQFSIEYDEALNSFKFEYLHMPFYNGTNDIRAAYRGLFGGTAKYKIQNREGGVLLHNLRAEDKVTGNDVDIWSGILGFNLAKLCPAPNQVNNTHLGAYVPQYTNSDVQLGTCFTGGATGLDIAALKTTMPIVTLPSAGLESIIGDTVVPILANGNFSTNNLDFGYFMVEINGLYNDGLITNTDIKKHIFGVISRYYENENYTAGSSADALIYTHKGSTLYLNQLGVRILDSNYNVASGLGDDNSVFIQHLKAVAPPQQSK